MGVLCISGGIKCFLDVLQDQSFLVLITFLKTSLNYKVTVFISQQFRKVNIGVRVNYLDSELVCIVLDVLWHWQRDNLLQNLELEGFKFRPFFDLFRANHPYAVLYEFRSVSIDAHIFNTLIDLIQKEQTMVIISMLQDRAKHKRAILVLD